MDHHKQLRGDRFNFLGEMKGEGKGEIAGGKREVDWVRRYLF